MANLVESLGKGEKESREVHIVDGHDCPRRKSCSHYDSSCYLNFQDCSRYNTSQEQKVR